MPYTTLVAGTTITAAWANANVRDQGIPVFATAASRDSAVTSPIDGMHAFTADTNRLWVYSGAAWRPIAGSMPRFRVVGGGAGQTGVVTATDTQCTWANGTEIEDTDALIAIGTGTFTCPAALAGRWRFDFTIAFDAAATGVRIAWLRYSVGPRKYATTTIASLGGGAYGDTLSGNSDIVLASGDTVAVYAHQNSGANRTVNTSADQYFQGRFISEN